MYWGTIKNGERKGWGSLSKVTVNKKQESLKHTVNNTTGCWGEWAYGKISYTRRAFAWYRYMILDVGGENIVFPCSFDVMV